MIQPRSATGNATKRASSYLDIWVCEDEFSDKAVIGKAVAAIADGEHEDDGGGVQAVACGQQARARLADVHHTVLHHLLRVCHVIRGARLRGGVDACELQRRPSELRKFPALPLSSHQRVAKQQKAWREGQGLLRCASTSDTA